MHRSSSAYRTPPACRRVLLALLVAVVGCKGDGPADPPPSLVDLHSSFESGLDGWTVAATDTLVGGAGIPWHVQPSTALAYEGSHALELYMANYTDAAKIWIVRRIDVPPSRPYHVAISYALGTRDYGTMNLFALIAGAMTTEPHTREELAATYQRDATSNGAASDVGYRWVQKATGVDVTADASGQLYVVVGVWGTFEVDRTYYIDALRVRVTPR